MADKAPPPPPDQNILVYVPDYASKSAGQPLHNGQPLHSGQPLHAGQPLHNGQPLHYGRSGGVTGVTAARGPPPFVAYRTYENLSRSAGAESLQVRSEAAESTVSSDSSPSPRDTETPPETIAPPFGWRRILNNGIIIYISPSNTALSSSDQVKSYLLTEGTCKCGLECPVNCDVIFNFNPKVLTRPWTAPAVAPGDLTKLCNHKRKLLTQSTSLENLDNRYDGLRRKKRRVGTPQPSVSQLLSQREQATKDQLSFNGFPWREGGVPQSRTFANGFPDEVPTTGTVGGVYRYPEPVGTTTVAAPTHSLPQLHRLSSSPRFPPAAVQVNEPQLPLPPAAAQQQVPFEQHRPPIQTYEVKFAKNATGRQEVPVQEQAVATNVTPGITVNRTPPWQQNKQLGVALVNAVAANASSPMNAPAPINAAPPLNPSVPANAGTTYERVPPLHSYSPAVASTSWSTDKRKMHPGKVVRKRYPDEEMVGPMEVIRGLPEQPSFMDDPSGYLAQQTALLNSTISRQNANSPSVEGVPLASNVTKYSVTRPKSRNASRFPDSSLEKRKIEEPSSTLPDRSLDDRGPIQGATVSTSNRSPVDSGAEVATTVVTTMASGHTVSSNTITSVLAGRANTATVTINNQIGLQKPPPVETPPAIARASSQGSSMSLSPAAAVVPEQQQLSKSSNNQQHILVSSNGQLIVANSSLLSPQQNSIQKIATTSPTGVNQMGVTSQVLNQQAVLVNTLPGQLLLQPSVAMVDGLNTVQIPQIVGNVVQNQVVDEGGMLSPDSKRKAASLKRRKLSPTVGNTTMLLSPQGTNNMVVQQPQQLNTGPMLQALTILPGKSQFGGTQQLITTNMLQPLNLVQNFPIQQFIVPAGVSGMVMSDGTILQDGVQFNVLTPVQNTGMFGNGQNLIAPGMVIRTPSSQSANKVIQNNQFLGSQNQFVMNNTFSGQLSPMLNVSPTQCSRSNEYVPQNVVVQQPNTSNTTVLQQNTTIVQQTTTVSNQQTHPTSTLNLNQNFILNEKPNFILTSEKQNFILSPNNEKILLNSDNRGNYVLGNIDKQNFVINSMDNKQNLIINNFDKAGGFIVDKKNSVSTQTANQVLQISSSPALVVATNSAVYNASSSPCFSGSPPDTTTLSPIDQEVTTSCLQRSASPPDPSSSSSQSCPMVHCISSSSQQEDGFSLDSYNSAVGKSYPESSDQTILCKNEDDYDVKTSLCNVPDSILASSEPDMHLKEEP
uniref:Methyl-CpG-binding domain protein 6 n=2 Tax=Lygus hesperus TaxID=30085 RepID=A0A0A9VRY9_LYGHE